MDAAWPIRSHAGVDVIRCAAFERTSWLGHGFSTRRSCGETGAFDLGSHGDDGTAIVERRAALCAAAGLGGRQTSSVHQVHGDRIVELSEIGPVETVRADGIVARRGQDRERVPAVRTADCVPLLLADAEGRAVAAVHAGWRGTAAGIASRAVERLGQLGVAPGALQAALGPAIGSCCYEVGDDVCEAVAGACGVEVGSISRVGPSGRAYLDLRWALRAELVSVGLAADHVHVAPWCTACSPELFYSYRRDGGPTGRMMACIGWARVP